MLKIYRCIFFLVLVNIFLICGCGSGTTTSNNNFPVVVFSDVHFDPFYDPSLFPALLSADASEWESVFKTSGITAPSLWGSDTNYPLLTLARSSIRQNMGASSLIIFTGDILGHNFSKTFFALHGSQDPPSDADVAAMKSFTDKTVAFFMQQVRSSVGNIPVMFAVGNSDSYIGALPEPGFLSHTAELYYTNFLNGIVDHQSFIDTFTTGGYYSADLPGTNLMVIGLNTVMFNYDFGNTLKSVADAELTWFNSQLAQAQAAGKKVWLLMHIPPGADKYETAKNVDASGHIASATMMWVQDYQTTFLQILSKYPGLITHTFAAHTHMDEYRIMSPGNMAYTTPGIAPYFGNNPAFKVFTFSSDNLKANDYTSLNYDLGTMPAQFNSYYTFSTAYSMQGFLNDSLTQLYPQLATDSTKQASYRGSYFSGHSYSNPTGNEFNQITNTTWPVYLCGIGNMDPQELIACVNAY